MAVALTDGRRWKTGQFAAYKVSELRYISYHIEKFKFAKALKYINLFPIGRISFC